MTVNHQAAIPTRQVTTMMTTKIFRTTSRMGTIHATSGKFKTAHLNEVTHVFLSYSEIINNKYILIQKLGWGHFSTVWLGFHLGDKSLYALKFQKSDEKYTESAYDEETHQ